MILLIDNYDSFVHNLARYAGRLGRGRIVARNDSITANDIAANPPDAIILSPGPKAPSDSGACMDIIRTLGPRIPILGVCLGHQCIGEVYGGRTIRAPYPVHGQASAIEHDANGLFMGMPNPFRAARYHSLICDLPANTPLNVTARTEDGLIMAFQHNTHPVYGIQFHPESILTDSGIDVLRNFFAIADQWNASLYKTRNAA